MLKQGCNETERAAVLGVDCRCVLLAEISGTIGGWAVGRVAVYEVGVVHLIEHTCMRVGEMRLTWSSGVEYVWGGSTGGGQF